MKIRMLHHVMTGAGTFKPGDEVDLADKNASPLIAAGAAELVKEEDSPRNKGAAKAKKSGRKP